MSNPNWRPGPVRFQCATKANSAAPPSPVTPRLQDNAIIRPRVFVLRPMNGEALPSPSRLERPRSISYQQPAAEGRRKVGKQGTAAHTAIFTNGGKHVGWLCSLMSSSRSPGTLLIRPVPNPSDRLVPRFKHQPASAGMNLYSVCVCKAKLSVAWAHADPLPERVKSDRPSHGLSWRDLVIRSQHCPEGADRRVKQGQTGPLAASFHCVSHK